MILSTLDWLIIFAFFAISLGIGLYTAKRAGSHSSEFFLSGRNMPWWLLGVSMVATTFATDTPNLVTGLVRKDGVSGNWVWWAFLISGMTTTFIFARLWRRSGVMTDVEFYELRYSGKSAAFLRGFRALYLGLVFNVLVMGNVCLAARKFGEVVLNVPGWQMLAVCGVIILIYSSLGGLRGVLLTDFFQFILAMIGSIAATYVILGHEKVGGLANMLATPEVASRLSILPDFSNPSLWVPMLLVPLAVQWWASYYPGSEPGGGGYIAQRMLAAKNEKHAMGATLFFNCAHYALRPWPWILIGLASLLVYPDLASISNTFPAVDSQLIDHDIAYPAMLTLLPSGLLGLVAASLLAAFMSTMSTQVNLGASYVVNDFYKRFVRPDASEKDLVRTGRLTTIIMIILGCGLGMILKSAKEAFDYMLLLGAGTGAIYILRWFWWRISAVTEIIAMISSLIIATLFTFVINPYVNEELSVNTSYWIPILLSVVPVLLTTAIWIGATFLTKPTSLETLTDFYKKIRPTGPGWEFVRQHIGETESTEQKSVLPLGILCTVLGTFAVYTALISTGLWIYGKTGTALILTIITAALTVFLLRLWKHFR